MRSIKIKIITEKQISAEIDLEEVIEHINSLPFTDRIPFLLKVLEGITENDIRFLPYSIGLTITQLIEDKLGLF